MKTKVLIRTEHGSWLYGLATPQSDYDYYEIFDFLNKRYRPKKQSHQRIEANEDEVQISLDRYQSLCLKGVPQAVEVLFSPPETWVYVDDSWHALADSIIHQLPDHMPTILDTYRRTALNFFKGDEKRKRHAFRLLVNAEELKASGRMHSRLTQQQINLINELTASFYCEEKFKDMIYRIF